MLYFGMHMKFWDNKCRLSTVRRIGTFVVLFLFAEREEKKNAKDKNGIYYFYCNYRMDDGVFDDTI